jgi:hypothetical protein
MGGKTLTFQIVEERKLFNSTGLGALSAVP